MLRVLAEWQMSFRKNILFSEKEKNSNRHSVTNGREEKRNACEFRSIVPFLLERLLMIVVVAIVVDGDRISRSVGWRGGTVGVRMIDIPGTRRGDGTC